MIFSILKWIPKPNDHSTKSIDDGLRLAFEFGPVYTDFYAEFIYF